MRRREFKALVTDNTGHESIECRTTYAWNSAITATQSIVRDYARTQGTTFSGSRAEVYTEPERIYRRNWESPAGEKLQAIVWEVL